MEKMTKTIRTNCWITALAGALLAELVTATILCTGWNEVSWFGPVVMFPSAELFHVCGMDTYPSEAVVREGIPLKIVTFILNPLIAGTLIFGFARLSASVVAFLERKGAHDESDA